MKRLLLLILSFWLCSAWAAPEADYVGVGACVNCHEKEVEEWKKSDHARSLLPATKESVVGKFDGQITNFHGLHFKPYMKGDEYWVESVNKKGEIEHFQVLYTFAYWPLQQYVIDLGNGHLHTHNVAWDDHPKEQGGQRWFHLQPNEEITPDHPFFWQNVYQNINARCAECHTTNYEKNYRVEDNSYHTTWSEVNVSCEACHGPASKHVDLANAEKLTDNETGFALKAFEPMQWSYQLDEQGKLNPNAVGTGEKSDQLIDMCAACHSRRTSVGPTQSDPTISYHDQFRVANLSEHLYYPDGQILDEVFVAGSFTQSKMHAAGVTCNNCHNVHTGKVRVEGNGLCAQCHMPSTFDTPEHHGHDMGTEGAECVTCHMPDSKYMVVDPRRDHSFKVPHPEFTEATGSPNVCQRCHEDKSNQWFIEQIDTWNSQTEINQWPIANAKGRARLPEAEGLLLKHIVDPELPAIIKATLYEQVAQFVSEEVLNQARADLADESPLVRRAAAELFRSAPQDLRWQALSPLLNDPSIQVRASVMSMLGDFYTIAPAHIKKVLDKAIKDYRYSMRETLDMPSSQTALALLELQMGNPDKAEQHYKQSLIIDPYYIPGMVNLADLYRSQGKPEKEEPLLSRALEIAPDSAAAQHGYGLYMLRQKKYKESLPYLYEGTRQVGAMPQYSLVYAVALDHEGETGKAIQSLQAATKKWPGQFQLLTTLVSYLEKENRIPEIMGPLRELNKIAPNATQVMMWRQKYLK